MIPVPEFRKYLRIGLHLLALALITGNWLGNVIDASSFSIPDLASSSQILISEVLADAAGSEPDGEWVEIYNTTRASLDLSTWKIGDEPNPGGTEGMMAFPAGSSIPPGATLVIANKATVFYANYGFLPDFEMLPSHPSVPDLLSTGWSNGSVALANDGDEVLLLDGNNLVADGLSWGSSIALLNPSIPIAPEGVSYARHYADVDTESRDDWINLTTPTPGQIALNSIQVYRWEDQGPGTLRQALLDAGNGATITFDTSAFPANNPTGIYVLSALPAVTQDNLTIDASDAGVQLFGWSTPGGTDGLHLDGSGGHVRGLRVQGFPGNGITVSGNGFTVGGNPGLGSNPLGQGNLISSNGGNGIEIRGSTAINNTMLGNIIGLSASADKKVGQGANGILIHQGANANHVGNGTLMGRNWIGGNSLSGVSIEDATTYGNMVQGNYLGTNRNGTSSAANGLHGVNLAYGTHDNLIGGNHNTGEGNLISGNGNHGVVISQTANNNTISGNWIGPDASGLHSLGSHPFGGIDLASGAHHNIIGGLLPGEGNLISGNMLDGIALFDPATADNQILGNWIGLGSDGQTVLPNFGDGIFHVLDAERTLIQGNLISGNQKNGVKLSGATSRNSTLLQNWIGTDSSGRNAVPNKAYGVRIDEGAHHHLLQENVISGNQQGGLLILDQTPGQPPHDNQVISNLIGLDESGAYPLGNLGPGILIMETAASNMIGAGNRIAYNQDYGVQIFACYGNQITQNEIYNNAMGGIRSSCLNAPQVNSVTLDGTDTITGTAMPDSSIELFSGEDEQGKIFEGRTTADSGGNFSFSKPGGFSGANLTATSTDANGNTSAFSRAAHLNWTFLLYLNGDNDLEEFMFNIANNLYQEGPSPRANILALVDGYTDTITQSGTMLYDLTYGELTPITPTWKTGSELNLGDGNTLVDFATWGKAYYPSRYVMFSIVDHGGGWAPSTDEVITGTLRPVRGSNYLAGNSGLSWDFTNDFDYLTSPELTQAFQSISQAGSDPIDVLVYDVCLMGMAEVAYQVKDFADYFVASQNIGWAPLGPEGRYVRMMLALGGSDTPDQLASSFVQFYQDSLPTEGHPFSISAVNLAEMDALASAVSQLGSALQGVTLDENAAEQLQQAYLISQKIDYDSDFEIEPSRDGFVDLYDFAQKVSDTYTQPTVKAAASAVRTAVNSAVIAEAHRSGEPWMLPGAKWDLNNLHGLSIFLPLGEDLVLPVVVTETNPISSTHLITRNLHLRELYTNEQLAFVGQTNWGGLIDKYYQMIPGGVLTDTTLGPVAGLQAPDIAPPNTHTTLSASPSFGKPLQVNWNSSDSQSGLDYVILSYQPYLSQWTVLVTDTRPVGQASILINSRCDLQIAVSGVDQAGNMEPLTPGLNWLSTFVSPCYRQFLGIILH